MKSNGAFYYRMVRNAMAAPVSREFKGDCNAALRRPGTKQT
jgi:hypothetical protein